MVLTLPWKSSTRPISQPAPSSRAATCSAVPFGADWFSTSTGTGAGAPTVGLAGEVVPVPEDVEGAGEEDDGDGFGDFFVVDGVGVPGAAEVVAVGEPPDEAVVTSSSPSGPTNATTTTIAAAMPMTAASWTRNSRASSVTGPRSRSPLAPVVLVAHGAHPITAGVDTGPTRGQTRPGTVASWLSMSSRSSVSSTSSRVLRASAAQRSRSSS